MTRKCPILEQTHLKVNRPSFVATQIFQVNKTQTGKELIKMTGIRLISIAKRSVSTSLTIRLPVQISNRRCSISYSLAKVV